MLVGITFQGAAAGGVPPCKHPMLSNRNKEERLLKYKS